MRGIGLLAALIAPVFVGGLTSCAAQSVETARTAASRPATNRPSTEVRTAATVLEHEGIPMLCLGGVAESLPPQCTGPTVNGWDWSVVDGETSASDVTWGRYRVQGMWDGETLTVIGIPMLETPDNHTPEHDPMSAWTEATTHGPLTQEAATTLLAELHEREPGILTSGFVAGRAVISVALDDGSLQAHVDERYGDDTVVVVSAFTPVEDD